MNSPLPQTVKAGKGSRIQVQRLSLIERVFRRIVGRLRRKSVVPLATLTTAPSLTHVSQANPPKPKDRVSRGASHSEPTTRSVEGASKPLMRIAIVNHKGGVGKTSTAINLSAALAEQGIAMLRFDFTGLGGSGGDFANTNFSSNVADLVAAADYIRANHGLPEILIGHSLGGAAVLAAAPKIADVRAIATINAPFDPAHVLRMMAAARPEIELAGEAEVTLGGRPFRIRKQFIEDIEQHQVTEGLKRMKKALLVMHAPLDATVNIDNASNIFLAARHPKSFVALDGADHMLSRREDATYAGSVLGAWAARYIAHPESVEADC